jgi:chaperonin GroES
VELAANMKQVIGKRVMCLYPWKANEEITTKGGVILPDAAKDKPNNLEVTLSGIDGISPGDKVVFNKYHGTTIEIENQEYLFLKEDEILGVL